MYCILNMIQWSIKWAQGQEYFINKLNRRQPLKRGVIYFAKRCAGSPDTSKTLRPWSVHSATGQPVSTLMMANIALTRGGWKWCTGSSGDPQCHLRLRAAAGAWRGRRVPERSAGEETMNNLHKRHIQGKMGRRHKEEADMDIYINPQLV